MAATCSEGFVICFLKVPLACLGSMAVAVQPKSLWNSQKIVYKTFRTSGRPTRYTVRRQVISQSSVSVFLEFTVAIRSLPGCTAAVVYAHPPAEQPHTLLTQSCS